jgi:hypothetical protein
VLLGSELHAAPEQATSSTTVTTTVTSTFTLLLWIWLADGGDDAGELEIADPGLARGKEVTAGRISSG